MILIQKNLQWTAAQTFRSAGVTRYEEGLDVGYRYFDTYGVPVLFPFGHGLHYAAFAYEGLACKVGKEGLELSYTLKNTSARDGKEVSEVYVHECAPLVYRPEKELKAFAKTTVAAGKRVKVEHLLPLRAFAHWSSSKDAWEVTDGVFEVLVGASSADIRLRVKVRIEDGKIALLGK